MTKKKDFLKQIVQESLMFRNQFHVKISCVVRISVQNLMCVKKMFHCQTRCKTSETKNDELCNKWFKNWFFFKNFDPKIQKNFHREKKQLFMEQLSQECTKNQLCCFYCVKWPDKWFFESEISNKFWFSQNSFLIEI